MTDTLAPYIVNSLKNLTINMSGSLNLTLFLFNYTLETFHINQIYLNYTKTGLNLTGGRFDLKISNFSFDCVAKAGFTTDPVLFFGKGDGRFNLSRLNVSLIMDLKLGPNNLPMIELVGSKVDISNNSLRMLFNGTNDVFTLLETIQGFVAPLIIETIGGVMKDETRRQLQDTINGVLNGLPNEIVIPGTDLALNYGLLIPPSMTNGYLPIALNGTFSCSGKACHPYAGPRPVPPKKIDPFAGTGSFQVLVSDYLVNTLLIAALEDSLIRFNVTSDMVANMTNGTIGLNTDLFGVFIPQIREKYGAHRNISMNFTAVKPPSLDITHNDITSTSSLTLS